MSLADKFLRKGQYRMYYLLIKGPLYGNMNYEAREQVREDIRKRMEGHGIRYVEYTWVWDEQDRCLLVVGKYENMDDAGYLIKVLEKMGFETCTRTQLPGHEGPLSPIKKT